MITTKINRINANIWRDVAKHIDHVTLIKLLDICLPKLQIGLEEVTIANTDGLSELSYVIQSLPNLKRVFMKMLKSDYEKNEEVFHILFKNLNISVSVYYDDRLYGEYNTLNYTSETPSNRITCAKVYYLTDENIKRLSHTLTKLSIYYVYCSKDSFVLPDSITSLKLCYVINDDITLPQNLVEFSCTVSKPGQKFVLPPITKLIIDDYRCNVAESFSGSLDDISELVIKSMMLRSCYSSCMFENLKKLTIFVHDIHSDEMLKLIPLRIRDVNILYKSISNTIDVEKLGFITVYTNAGMMLTRS